jgi:hypothetical protein
MKDKILEILREVSFGNREIEEVLDGRDEPVFDAKWIQAYEKVRSCGAMAEQSEIDQVRELSFKAVFASTGNPDIAAAVSDDLGLVMSAAILDFEDSWGVNSLWLEYKSRRIPTGSLSDRPGRLRDMIG